MDTVCRLTGPQWRVYNDPHRFRVLVSGRRFGKTRLAIEELIRAAHIEPERRVWYVAPTYRQAQQICWQILKTRLMAGRWISQINESRLSITLKNGGSTISLRGADNFDSLRGVGLHFLVMDEFADIKPEAWFEVLRATLSDTGGGALFTGTPKGRNWAYDLFLRGGQPDYPEWASYSFTTIEGGNVPPEEVEIAKKELDEITFAQEFCASFALFAGRAYYNFDTPVHTSNALTYNPRGTLIFCFDFNVSPGVAAVCQEQVLPGCFERIPNPRLFRGTDALRQAMQSTLPEDVRFIRRPVTGTGVIGEVYIPHNSTTPAVCNKLIQDWGDHQGEVCCYGDASGGARGSAKVSGSDWELIEQTLAKHFGDRLSFCVPRANPAERARVNAMNSRLKAADGTVYMLVDGNAAPHVVRDLEGVRVLEGGSGEIDKRHDKNLTHMCFAGETMVNGMRIDQLPESGLVRTIFGSAKYVNPGVRGESELIELVFHTGDKVRCTPNHPILTTLGWQVAKDCLQFNAIFHRGHVPALEYASLLVRNSRQDAERLLHWLISEASSGLYVCRVVKINPVAGKHPVYCPTVTTGHFCLDCGLVVSNSDALGYYVSYEFPAVADQELAEMPVSGRF